MKLNEVIQVNSNYTRSVNVERDLNQLEAIQGYIPTSRSVDLINKFTDCVTSSSELTPRSWSLIGPYGSGKSSAAVFLANLLSGFKTPCGAAASEVIKKHISSQRYVALKKASDSNNGFLKIMLTGSPEPLGVKLFNSIRENVKSYQEQYSVELSNTKKLLKREITSSALYSGAIIEILESLQSELKNIGSGIVLIIDEFGKFLEYEARNYGANDIFLLQELAELACKTKEINLFLFVILHQSFDHYAKGLSGTLKVEWSKIQGRFEEINFVDTFEQTLKVVGKAIEKNLSAEIVSKIELEIEEISNKLYEINAIPASITLKEAKKIFFGCYPLHPISAILLPQLTQKIAQNERTLFSYLGSREAYGLKNKIEKMAPGEWILPVDIYNYFVENQTSILGDHITNKRWVEVLTAIERLTPTNKHEIRILKTIGILNITGSKAGFKASKDLLNIVEEEKTLNEAIKVLLSQSVITHRKYNNELRIWQGSDFDLDQTVRDEIDALGIYSLVEELNKTNALAPLVARKYSIEKGSIRYFQPIFADATTYKKIDDKSNECNLIIYVSTGQDDIREFNTNVINYFGGSNLVCHYKIGTQLRDIFSEYQALQRIERTCKELHSDPVAKREFDERYSSIEYAKNDIINSILSSPEKSDWYFESSKLAIHSSKCLQIEMSKALDVVYKDSPIIRNELINRDRPSAQAVAARNKLLQAMLLSENKQDLGIEKFPPEKAIYRSVLAVAGLHRVNNDGEFEFSEITNLKEDKNNFKPTWNVLVEFIKSTASKPRSFVELNDKLMSAPYGIKAGVLPILYVLTYLKFKNEMAVYEGRLYKPTFDSELLERFNKRPDEFYFQYFKIEGIKASLFESYSNVIFGGEKTEKKTVIQMVEPLAVFMGGLPDYVKKTRNGLSKDALALRKAFELSRSPENLLFTDIPKALGFADNLMDSDNCLNQLFSEKLKSTLRELNQAYNNLLKRMTRILAESFELEEQENLESIRNSLTVRFNNLNTFTSDTQGLKGFLIRIVNDKIADSEWLENILIFLSQKAPKKWNDQEYEVAISKMRELSDKALDLEKIRISDGFVTGASGAKSILLRAVKEDGTVNDKVVHIDSASQNFVTTEANKLLSDLRKNKDFAEQMKILAFAVDRFFEITGSQNDSKK